MSTDNTKTSVSTFDHLPFILAHCADCQGCGWHRIVLPASLLKMHALANVTVITMHWPIERIMAAEPDVIIWQRQIEKHQIERMREVREKLPNAIMVYELDDHLGDVPDENWHSAFLPPVDMILDRMREALELCDHAVVTTPYMAQWMQSLARPGFKVHIVPNILPELDDTNTLPSISARPGGRKLRLGWGGGISHSGDFEQMAGVFDKISEMYEVEWQFIGADPREHLNIAITDYTFHGAAATDKYLQALSQLDLDLVIAPAADNNFNRAKSNLRLIQSGFCGSAVIASPVEPYTLDDPPVFGYASNADQWIEQIGRFIKGTNAERLASRRAMREWSMGWSLSANLDKLTAAWGVANRPSLRTSRAAQREAGDGYKNLVVAGFGGQRWSVELPDSLYDRKSVEISSDTLEAAWKRARDLGCDLLYVRPGTTVSDYVIDRLLDTSKSLRPKESTAIMPKIAAITCLSNDGGVSAGFPKIPIFSQVDDATGKIIESCAAQLASHVLPVEMAWPAGPCFLIRREALFDLPEPQWLPIGKKDAAPDEIPSGFRTIVNESAIIEWAWMTGNGSNWRTWFLPGAYAFTTAGVGLAEETVKRINSRTPEINVNGKNVAAIEHVVSTSRVNMVEWLANLEVAVAAAKHRVPIPNHHGDFNTWSSYYSGARGIASAKRDTVDIKFGDQKALDDARKAQTKWVRFYSDGLLDLSIAKFENAPSLMTCSEALAETAETAGDVDFCYGDSQIVVSMEQNGQQQTLLVPDFKPPTLDKTLLYGRDYLSDCVILRLDKWLGKVPNSRNDVYARLIEMINHGSKSVHRGDVLIMRPHANSDVGLQESQQRMELLQPLLPDHDISMHRDPGMEEFLRVKRKTESHPAISMVMPTAGSRWLIRPALATILRTPYAGDLELIVAVSGPKADEHAAELMKLDELRDPRIRLVKVPMKIEETADNWKFNFSAVNNHIINTEAKHDMICIINDDVRVLALSWLDEMVAYAVREDVGIVGARLSYPNPTSDVQHVGVICHHGINGHIHKGLVGQSPGYWGSPD